MNAGFSVWEWILVVGPSLVIVIGVVAAIRFDFLSFSWRNAGFSRSQLILALVVAATAGVAISVMSTRQPAGRVAPVRQAQSRAEVIVQVIIPAAFLGWMVFAYWKSFDRVIWSANRKAKGGDVDGAITELQSALATEPPTFPRLNMLGTLLLEKDRHAEALGAFDDALAMVREKVTGPKVDHLSLGVLQNNRGASLYKLDRFEDALDAYDAARVSLDALKADTRSATFANSTIDYLILDGRARCLAKLGRVDEATEAFRASEALFAKVIKQYGGEQKAMFVTNFEGTKALVKPEAAGLGDDFA